jgi:translation initiation factor 2-alpha kinase 4
MESPEELQQLEITALRSIYADDLTDCPPPTVWKVRHCLTDPKL